VPLMAVGTATWACGLTANRSRTYVPSHSDPGPPEIPTRTRNRGGVTSLQGPDTPVMSVDLLDNHSGKAIEIYENW
jgi:hypothetical protein